jgi:hypothetical protein
MKLDNLNRSLDGLDPKKKANDEKDAESPMFKPQKTKAGRKMRRQNSSDGNRSFMSKDNSSRSLSKIGGGLTKREIDMSGKSLSRVK